MRQLSRERQCTVGHAEMLVRGFAHFVGAAVAQRVAAYALGEPQRLVAGRVQRVRLRGIEPSQQVHDEVEGAPVIDATQDVKQLRRRIRSGEWTGSTSGMARDITSG